MHWYTCTRYSSTTPKPKNVIELTVAPLLRIGFQAEAHFNKTLGQNRHSPHLYDKSRIAKISYTKENGSQHDYVPR